jgi:endonuclease/exonuclease/phosphatase family metal-dependent hydrolase
VLSVYSKFPILSKDHIYYPSVGNHSSAFQLKIGRDTVLLVNNHLETTGLSPEEKEQFKSLVKGNLKNSTAKVESKRLIDKLGEASAKRAPEAETVARYVSQHSNESVILCGDFNDGPLSYVHRTLARNLTDCYKATGNGPGISYHHGGFYVRIDNIFCSDDWVPYGCKVDNKIKASDHYPILCWLKKRPKQ